MKEVEKTLTVLVSLVLVISLVNLVSTFGLYSKLSNSNNAVAVPTAQGNEPQEPTRVEGDLTDDDAVLGNEDAEVTIVEFSDFQCPFCRKFWTDTFEQIKTEYVDTGKVKFVYRDFPLEGLHPMALSSAIAAECVREKGGDSAYYKYHDKMFQEQNTLDGGTVRSTVSYSNADLKKWAKDLGYDIDSCLDSEKYKGEVQKDLSQGASYGVQGTPAFFVNGNFISGAQPYSVFKAAIEQELNK